MNDKHQHHKENLAGKLAHIFLNSKLIILGIIGSIIIGALALLFTPRTYNPEIVVPVINISVSRPGSNVNEILNQIVRPLEGLMSSIPAVDHTYGMANDDHAMVTVRFKVNENEETSLVKVYNQINSNIDRIPSGTFMPLIQSVSLYDVPLLTITLSSQSEDIVKLRVIANKVLEQLRSVPQVGKNWIMGSSETAVKVWLDPVKLEKYAIPVQVIQQALENNNLSFNEGNLESGQTIVPLRVNSKLYNAEDLKRILLSVYDAKPIYLADVATVQVAPANEDIISYIASGKASNTKNIGKLTPAITIALARQKGSNGVDVANAILQRLSLLKGSLLPPSVTVKITRNYGADANEAVNTLIEHLGISILAIVGILLLFLGWREAAIVTISIPVILFIVLGIGWLSGQTINRITLFALILSMGLLVDDSIVVIENIHRHIKQNTQRNFARLITFAANEIGKPTIIATFTVILALLPMAFVGGMMGPFMLPIPFNAPIAMLVSLIVAYTVVPYLAYHWLRGNPKKLHNKHNLVPTHSTLDKIYFALFNPLVASRKKRHLLFLLIAILLVLAMLQPLWQFIRSDGSNGPLSYGGVALKMLPDDNVNTFLIEVDANKGTPMVVTKQVTTALSDVLAKNNVVNDYRIFLGKAAPEDFAAMVRGDNGNSGSHYAQIRVNLLDKAHRRIGSHQIVQMFNQSIQMVRNQFPDVKIKIFESPPGPPVRSQMEAALSGKNYNLLRDIATKIAKDIYPSIYGVMNVDNSVSENYPEYQIIIDRNKAVQSGFIPARLAGELATYFTGIKVGSIHSTEDREPQNIMLRLPKLSRQNIEALQNLKLINQQKEPIALRNVASFKLVNKEKPIFTRDQHPVVYLTAEMLQSSPVYGVLSITKQLSNFRDPDGASLEVGNLGFVDAQPNTTQLNQFFWLGEMRLTLDVFRDLGSAFIIALLLIYLLLTGFYRSFFIPLIIMGAIPLTLIGVFPGHWLLNQPFTATSMIGVIALSGIVVRNSLLLIDFIIENQRLGSSLQTAVIAAGTARIRPIILTALAIILGSSVMISDPVFGGLAISLIFGIFASTTLTLFVIPLVYYGWKRQRH